MPRRRTPAAKTADPVIAMAAGMSSTGKRYVVKSDAPRIKPSEALVTQEQQDAFCEAITEHAGITPACTALGFHPASVFSFANRTPAFREAIDASLKAVHEAQVFRCQQLCEDLLAMDAHERMQSANAYGKVFDWSMRIIGKLSPKVYGDRPTNQTLVQTNNLVCDEETRAKLIALNQKLLEQNTMAIDAELTEGE